MKNEFAGYCYYIQSKDIKLFTVVLLPNETGKFPVIVIRNPYVDDMEKMSEEDITTYYLYEQRKWLNKGYAIVIQHCRGRGKSEGDCIPYINERSDSRMLYDWIRNQDFYDGELYLIGGSYTTSVHYAAAPYGDDIKGAIFSAQDCERYNICYRNGFFKKNLHGHWYINGMYKKKSTISRNYSDKSLDTLPLSSLTQAVFGESAEDLDEVFKHPNRNDEFWNTHMGGSDARNAIQNVKFPVLLTTAMYDIYTGGVFDMWNNMSEYTKSISALVVSAYDHGDNPDSSPIHFPKGNRYEQFGEFEVQWLQYIRGIEKSPFETGKVTYYRLFENCWKTDAFPVVEKKSIISLGEKTVGYTYNPYSAPEFKGGLSTTFGGAAYQDKPNSKYDIVSVYSKAFESDTFIKGKMSAKLCVKSDCEDTCFYLRVSITKDNGDYGLRDDITSLCHQLGDYIPNTEVILEFSFDEIAFLIKKGEKLRVDIASANNAHYVRHTNIKGLFSEQKEAKIAHNTVLLGKSFLTLPVE